MKPIIDRLKGDEQVALIAAARAAAVAIAEFWDALRDIESAHEISIEYTDSMLSSLAGDCSSPPSFSDLETDTVIDALREGLYEGEL